MEVGRSGLVVVGGEAVEASVGSCLTGVNGAVISRKELLAAPEFSWHCSDLLVRD